MGEESNCGEREEGDLTQRAQRKSALRLRSGQAEFAEKRTQEHSQEWLCHGLLTMAQDVARNRFYEAGFDLVVTAIQRGSYFGEFRNVAGHGVFD